MSKNTAVLSVTKNLFILRTKDTQILIQIVITQYQSKEQVAPKTRNRKLPCLFIFGDTSHISTIQNMKSKIRIHI